MNQARVVSFDYIPEMIGDETQHAGVPISLSSQLAAQAFYQGLGFVAEGDSYDDGGIEHITMWYRF